MSLIYKRMSHAAMRAGRGPEEVTLVAVTKAVDAGKIREAVEAGVRVFGESRVQEAAGKIEELRKAGVGGSTLSWHMVGHLQKNKARAAVEIFDLIHSLDSVDLAGLLDRHAALAGKLQRALLQVKLSTEESKHGVEEGGLEGILKAAEGMENLRIEGLMTIPPYFDDPERARPFFRRLKALAESFGLRELSMGMTNDFEVAIEEGATMVRIGTAIFGERDYRRGGRP